MGFPGRRIAQRNFGRLGPEFAQMVPGGETAQQPGLLEIFHGGQVGVQPPFEEQELPVLAGQDAALHEQVA